MANKNLNLFEATMRACQQVKKENFEANKKKKTAKKCNRNSLTESKAAKKPIKKKLEAYDPELDDSTSDEPIADDVSNDIVVVTDPDMNVDEYEDRIDELEDIIDDTPEGEVPTDDEYINEEVYSCPVCGNNFFSDEDMSNGGTCPVCGEEADAFVLIGTVESSEESGEDNPEDEDLEIEEPDEDLEVDDEIEECYDYSLNEGRVNSLLTKFITENYKNAKSMSVTGARIRGNRLTLECVINMNSGKSKNVKLIAENFKPVVKKPFQILVSLDKTFKTESKKDQADVVFSAKIEGKEIKVTGMKYKFETLREGKRYEISSNYVLKESKKPSIKRAKKVNK